MALSRESERLEGFGLPVEAIESSGCAEPQCALAVLVDDVDGVIAQAGRVLGIVEIVFPRPAGEVEAVQAAVVGANPQLALVVLEDLPDRIAGQAVGVPGSACSSRNLFLKGS